MARTQHIRETLRKLAFKFLNLTVVQIRVADRAAQRLEQSLFEICALADERVEGGPSELPIQLLCATQ
jgi:hypothetical protein